MLRAYEGEYLLFEEASCSAVDEESVEAARCRGIDTEAFRQDLCG